MKKIATLLVLFALTFSGAQLHAQPRGQAARGGATQGSDWAWGIGLFSLAVLGTVSGIIAASATESPTTFSHNN